MDDATLLEFRTLQRCVGEHTAGLGELLLEYPAPHAALAAPEARLSLLPPATQRALAKARRAWPAICRHAPVRPQRLRDGPGGDEAFLPITDDRYPGRLRASPDPPPWLFCRGRPDILDRPAVAIVGSRRASRSGLQVAAVLARTLARSGYLVCSGLALGIDAAAHRGALDAADDNRRGVTLAVLASGLDRPSPAVNAHLARQVAAAGCLLSELPPGTRPNRARFPRRNRIISGLSSATIIVEAALPSGSLHTAAAALEQGRDVFVLPWSIFHAQGAGCLRLLRDGATPITALEDLADFFPGLATPAETSRPAPRPDAADVSPLKRELLELIGDGAPTAEALQAATERSAAEIFEALSDLEIDGHLVRRDGLYERRV